ncbi:hypothetical protein BD410DRAFT_681567, partial [Rickenella mellea]
QARQNNRGKRNNKSKNDNKSSITCTNCKKNGHSKENCWAKGGDKEGQGPRQKARSEKGNQATDSKSDTNDDLRDNAYMATDSTSIGRSTWITDSGTTSHI